MHQQNYWRNRCIHTDQHKTVEAVNGLRRLSTEDPLGSQVQQVLVAFRRRLPRRPVLGTVASQDGGPGRLLLHAVQRRQQRLCIIVLLWTAD